MYIVIMTFLVFNNNLKNKHVNVKYLVQNSHAFPEFDNISHKITN